MTESPRVLQQFFAATRALACHTASLQERLADVYADHLLQVFVSDLPAELQPAFRELEQQMTTADVEGSEDPFLTAAERLNDQEARILIERIVALFARLAGPGDA